MEDWSAIQNATLQNQTSNSQHGKMLDGVHVKKYSVTWVGALTAVMDGGSSVDALAAAAAMREPATRQHSRCGKAVVHLAEHRNFLSPI